ncbi:MAG: GNAT family N-acetyltransferase, partial [Microlunatus sp.]|nr:GNAT family N-acetyltransferase [Microlunatus sp.]
MKEITVRVLGEDEWSDYRAIRLAALEESPEAFSSSHAEEANHREEDWRAAVRRAHRLLATGGDDAPVGVVSVGPAEEEQSADLFGLWVTPAVRNTGVAWRLVEAAAAEALREGWIHLYYWVGTQNGRAIGFATNFGFRPTSRRRSARVPCGECGEHEEVALVLT